MAEQFDLSEMTVQDFSGWRNNEKVSRADVSQNCQLRRRLKWSKNSTRSFVKP